MKTLDKLSALFAKHGELGIDRKSTISLSEGGDAFWLKLATEIGSVEGKLFLPATATTRLLIFVPGFPGGGSTDFETHHLKGFLSEGYAIFLLRHNGSFLTGLHSDYYISCPQRQKKAEQEKQQVLGETGRQYTIGDWLLEPQIAITALAKAFDEVTLLGHSFGGLAIFYSLTEFGHGSIPLTSKIKRIISLAGATGRVRAEDDRIMENWEQYLDTEWAQERVSIGELANNLKVLRYAYKSIHSGNNFVPNDSQVLFAIPWGDTADSIDEIVSPLDTLDMIVTLGRGTLIIDKTQKSDTETGLLAHDMASLKTNTLLKLADSRWVPPKQILVLDKRGLH